MDQIQIGKLRLVVAPEEVETPNRELSFPVSKPKDKARSRRPISQAKIILAIAKMQKWEGVRKVGRGDIVDQPIEINGWLAMPIEMYKGSIPSEARLRTEAIINAGIKVKGFLIAEDQRYVQQQLTQNKPAGTPSVRPDWHKTALEIGKGAVIVAIGIAVISFLPIIAVGAALTYDPLLIAVTTEDEWVCIYEWWH